MMRSSRVLAVLPVLACLTIADGYQVLAQQLVIPVHPIGEVLARSTDSLGSVASIRALSDGHVLINDIAKHRLILLDESLQGCRTVADTTSATNRLYGTGLTGMIPFAGDSTLIQDGATSAFLVFDPAGNFARLIPAPRSASNPPGGPSVPPLGVDHAGHLLYHQPAGFGFPSLPPSFIGDTSFVLADSTIVRRVNLTTWRSDTLAKLRASATRAFVTRSVMANSTRTAASPIQAGDDLGLLSDGALAIVRARDYHVDWVAPDGHMTSSPPIPTTWIRLTDSMKVAILDSVRARDSVNQSRIVTAAIARGAEPPNFAKPFYVAPSDLPDHQPLFISGNTRVDADGNLWIMVAAPTARTGPTFDIINRQGERVDRVGLPLGATLVGFGPGVLYFSSPYRQPTPGQSVQLVVARIR